MGPTEALLAGETDLAGFRAESRQLLAHQVPPDDVTWRTLQETADLYEQPQPPSASRPRSVARAATAIVPASFLRLCESVVLHRDPERFALLYRLLWRLVHEPGLRNDPVDADMARAQHMAHAVRRDIHKMKSYLKFVEVTPAAGTLRVAYFEPAHHILEAVAPWYARRNPGETWAIFTPERCVYCQGRNVQYGPGLPRDRVPSSESDSQEWSARIEEFFGSPEPTPNPQA